MMIKINDCISYLKASDEPLSSDCVIINDNGKTVLFDVGNNPDYISELDLLNINDIVISHFHLDHIGNLDKLNYENVYCGKFAKKHISNGIIVSDKFDLSENLSIYPLPSAHAKGSLLLVYKEYCFVGDGIYGNKNGYDVSLLSNAIKLLNSLDVKYICLSHDEKFIFTKEEIIERLQFIFSKREKNNPYISYEFE